MAWFLLAWACSRGDPWAGAPVLAGDPVRTEWWSLSLADSPIGWEERRYGEGRDAVTRRALVVASGRERAWLRSASRVRCDAAGCAVTLWRPEGTRTAAGAFAAPELWPPEGAGAAEILDEGAEPGCRRPTWSTATRSAGPPGR
ncbi:MAG: hypothetical protein R3F59_09130 [Myxococcota bacterium]